LEQDARVTAGVHGPVRFAMRHDPDSLERVIAALWQRNPLGLLPLPIRLAVGEEDLRPIEGRGDGREQATASRTAGAEVDRFSGKRARLDRKAVMGSTREQEQPLLRPQQQLGQFSPSCDRRQYLDAVRGTHSRALVSTLAVDKHVDVAPDRAALVENPAV